MPDKDSPTGDWQDVRDGTNAATPPEVETNAEAEAGNPVEDPAEDAKQ